MFEPSKISLVQTVGGEEKTISAQQTRIVQQYDVQQLSQRRNRFPAEGYLIIHRNTNEDDDTDGRIMCFTEDLEYLTACCTESEGDEVFWTTTGVGHAGDTFRFEVKLDASNKSNVKVIHTKIKHDSLQGGENKIRYFKDCGNHVFLFDITAKTKEDAVRFAIGRIDEVEKTLMID